MVQLHLSKVEIVALVEHVMSSFRHMAEIKSTEYVLNSGISSLDLWLDAPKIESALKNLLSNALKYTPKGGKIRVTITEKEVDGKMFCLLSVADNGPGIAENLQGRIFESFITGENDPSFSTKVGIGSAVSLKTRWSSIMGKVLHDSAPGKGSEFILYLRWGTSIFKEDVYHWLRYP